MPKSALGPINSSRNKLNSEIIFIYNSNPNAHLVPTFLIIKINLNIFPLEYSKH